MDDHNNTWKRLLSAARGSEPADLVLKGGRIINVFSGRLESVDLAISEGWIVGLGQYQGLREVDLNGRFVAPGLIEPHLHLESSMVSPSELSKVIVPRGTTTLIADPHEIANVLGLEGIKHLIDISSHLPVDIFFMAPSCVPATHLETGGMYLAAADLRPLLAAPRVLGLAEVMNFPGVIHGWPPLWEKIDLFSDRPMDGHAPLLRGPNLNAYALAGMATEHECTNLEEAGEKLDRGIYILIREGSQAKNLTDLLPLITDHNFRRIAFCTDDRHPEDLLTQGHLDNILRLSVAQGLDPIRAITMSTINAAQIYGLHRRGALAPGYRADIVVFEDMENFVVDQVYKNGGLVARDQQLTIRLPEAPPTPDWVQPMNLSSYSPDTLEISVTGRRVRIIEYLDGQILTGHLIEDVPECQGKLCADPERDLVRLVVMERHRGTGFIGQGLLKGLGLKSGAIASSIAHDSHNIVAAGLGSSELYLAIKTVEEMHGGLVVVSQSQVMAKLPLPLAGLMSDQSLSTVAESMETLKIAAGRLGCRLANPFMALSFLALPVIPHLKLTDQGLVDVDRFAVTDLFLD
ncbi:MAG: adenine deaminase [Deltaproteobacteria bacterium]|nr:adenine deaminase [Deltaproteobacteria bacterium]